MYADDTPVDQMRDERMKCQESKCRSRSVEENLKIWEEMRQGSETGQKNCMRLKMDMKSENGCLRDPVAYRVNLTSHHRTGRPGTIPTISGLVLPSLPGLTCCGRTLPKERAAYPTFEPQALHSRCTRRMTLLAPLWTRSRE